MILLGIFDGAHDTGAGVVCDGRVLAAVNEERLSRVKMQGSFPARAIPAALDAAGVRPQDVDAIALAGVLTPQLYFRAFRWLQRRCRLEEGLFYSPRPDWRARVADFIQFRSGVTEWRPESWIGRMEKRLIAPIVRRDFPPELKQKPIRIVDHHDAHAACAYFCSGFDPCLCVTADGVGDGASFCIYRGQGRRLRRLHAVGPRHSIPVFYALVTAHLGFIPFRDEGKVLGLSARGRAERVDLPFPIELTPAGLRGRLRFGQAARPFLRRLERYAREDVAAWLQRHTERLVAAAVAQWAERTGLRRLALAGGLFANVRLNQLLWRLPQIDEIYVFPHMGDGGLAVGAALAEARPEPEFMEHVFLGPEFGEREIERALQAGGLPYERPSDLERAVVERLAAGRAVARFDGRMEYGPRALGHRSILASAEDPAVCDRLNAALGRSPFMPFAPSTPAEAAAACYEPMAGAARAAAFMTMTFDATPLLRERCPAVVHVDGTARAQIVHQRIDPAFHRILSLYAAATGRPCLLNTSFNMHEEPIVCSPSDAVDSFRRSGLDALSIGPFLARQA